MMKKLYTLILLLFCFTSSFAQSEFNITKASNADCSFETRLSMTDVIFVSNPADTVFNLLKRYYENLGIRVIEYNDEDNEYFSKSYFYELKKYALKSPDYTHKALTVTGLMNQLDNRLYMIYQDPYLDKEYEKKYYVGRITKKNILQLTQEAISLFPKKIDVDIDYQLPRSRDVANWSREEFVSYAKNSGLDTFEGIYVSAGSDLEYYVKKHGGNYYVVASKNVPNIEGDVIAELTPTAKSNFFLGKYFLANYSVYSNKVQFIFTEIGLNVNLDGYGCRC